MPRMIKLFEVTEASFMLQKIDVFLDVMNRFDGLHGSRIDTRSLLSDVFGEFKFFEDHTPGVVRHSNTIDRYCAFTLGPVQGFARGQYAEELAYMRMLKVLYTVFLHADLSPRDLDADNLAMDDGERVALVLSGVFE